MEYDALKESAVIIGAFVVYLLIGMLATIAQARQVGRVDGRTITLWPFLVIGMALSAMDWIINKATGVATRKARVHMETLTENTATVTIPKGTLIHVGGMPFRAISDIEVGGSYANLRLGLEALAESAAAPKQSEAQTGGA